VIIDGELDGGPAAGAGGARSIDLDALWAKTRQGSATVAGVDYQAAVSAALLVHARTGPIEAVAVRPEGFEDIDCLIAGGGSVLVQAKDRAGGETTWTRSEMAAAIAHAASALEAMPEAHFVIATNARPGEGLAVTGWTGSIAEALSDEATTALRSAARDIDGRVDDALLARCGLHHVSRAELADEAIAALADAYGIPLSVAEIAFCVLLDDVQQLAAGQRTRDLGNAGSRTPADLDALIHQVRSTVDVGGLEEPIRSGLIAPVDFSSPIDLTVESFLLGVNVRPGHIAADLDVLRADEAADDRGALIAGPSGSGKSALMWRCARELDGPVRLIELRRAADHDVEDIVRWLRTQRPTPATKLLVCADDLGHPGLSGWPALAARLVDVPGVLLLATCREEDLRPSLLADGLQLLRPALDETLAAEVAAQLGDRGVHLRRDAAEAFADARGLLLEYVALLTTGERLGWVVAAQVHDRFDPERTAEREALRYVCTAHIAGLSVPFDALDTLVARSEELPAALARLRDEFLVRADAEGGWAGLHELRSGAAHDALHATPPPSEEATVSRLLPVFEPAATAHLLRRVADRGMSADPLAEGLDAALRSADAAGIGTLLQAAFDVDALAHARVCWDMTLATWGAAGADGALTIAFIARFGGAPGAATNFGTERLARMLPEPPTHLAANAAATLTPADILSRLLAAPAEDAAALLESVAVAAPLELTAGQAQEILAAQATAAPEIYARLVYAVWCLSPSARDDPSGILGPRNVRLNLLAAADERVLNWTTDEQPGGGVKVSVDAFMVEGGVPTEARQRIGRLALDLCPEATGIRLTPCPPRGAMQSVPAQEGMDAPRSAIPSRRIDTRRNLAFLTAIERLRAAESWSERIALQRQCCERLSALLRDARLRLALAHDNAGRAKLWITEVADVATDVGRLPTPPLPRRGEAGVDDAARSHLDRALGALTAIARSLQGEDVSLGGVGAGLYDLAAELQVPPTGAGAALVVMVQETLAQEIGALSRLMLVQHERRSFKVSRRRAGQEWAVTIDAATTHADAEIAEEERVLVARAVDGLDADVHVIDLPDPSEDVSGRRILVVVPDEHRDVAVWDRLNQLGDGERRRVAFRVIVLPQRDGLAMPTEAWEIGSSAVYPAHALRVAALAQAALLPVLDLEDLDRTLEILGAIVDASAKASLAGARNNSRFDAEAPVRAAEEALERCRMLARDVTIKPAARAVSHLIEITEREIRGELVMSQIVGNVLLREYGDENHHSMLLSGIRGILVGEAVRTALAADKESV